MIAAYPNPDPSMGRMLKSALIESISEAVPASRTEVITLGRTLKTRRACAGLLRPARRRSNRPTEAINADWNTCSAPHWASAISPNTSPDPCWK